MKKSELRQIIKEEIQKVLIENKPNPLFKVGDEVVINITSLDTNAKKFNGKKGIVSSKPMKYSDNTYSYLVKVGRTEVEFKETELKNI